MKANPLFFLIPLLVLLGTATTVAALESRRTPDWQTTLNRYLAENTQTGKPAQVQTITRARRPDRFTHEMGSSVSHAWQWQIERLPSPPQELYCVLLHSPVPGMGDEPPAQVLYVGYRTDALYRTGWIVHAGPHSPFPASLPRRLAAVGCDLTLP
ncbi:MAG: hypothetical protein IT329_02715 [Caldilineaceae bacterium]|nr:hypothetical protein [Caldilineaceae bacterium]